MRAADLQFSGFDDVRTAWTDKSGTIESQTVPRRIPPLRPECSRLHCCIVGFSQAGEKDPLFDDSGRIVRCGGIGGQLPANTHQSAETSIGGTPTNQMIAATEDSHCLSFPDAAKKSDGRTDHDLVKRKMTISNKQHRAL